MCQHNRQRSERQRATIWKVPDNLWCHIKMVLPPEKEPGTPGRPLVPFCTVFNGMLYVLRTGCQWKTIPESYSSDSTVHRCLQQWSRQGLIDQIARLVLRWYERTRRIWWCWHAADTKMLPAPLGETKTGANSMDRGRCGTKRHLIVDGRGVPLRVYLTGANYHGQKGLLPLLNATAAK